MRRILTIMLAVLAVSLCACRAGIDPASSANISAISIAFSGLDGSGTADDPAKIEKGTTVEFSVTDSDGNPVDVTWGVAGVSADVSAVRPEPVEGRTDDIQFDTNASCGGFSGNTYTAPSSIIGNGECLITAAVTADPSVTGSLYTRTTVGNEITYTSIPAYSASSGYTVSGGTVAVAKGIANVVISSSSFNASTGVGNGTLLGTYQTDLSSSFTSFPAALPVFEDILGLPTPLTSSESYVHFAIGRDGRCYYVEMINTKVLAFYDSDDCSDLSSIVWNGPHYIMDSGITIYNYSPIMPVDMAVDSDGFLHFLWADPRYRGTETPNVDSPNADVFYDRCSRAGDGSYSCTADTCLTCNLGDDVGKPYDVHIEVYGSGSSARVNGFWVAGAFDTYTSSCNWSTTTCASGNNGTFSAPAVISDESNIGMMQTAMDRGDGRLYVVGQPGGDAVVLNYSVDGGGSFSQVTVMPGGSSQPSIYADDDGSAYIVAMKNTLDKIGFSKSTNGGADWSAVGDIDITGNEISNNPGSVPFITGDGTNLYILYWAADGATARFMASSDDGATWSSPVAISIGGQDIILQSTIRMAPVEGGVYVPLGARTTGDECQGGCAPSDPYLTRCTSAGVCETPVVVGVQARQQPFMFPLSFSNTNASNYGMLWSDGRNGNYDVYFASAPFGTNPGGEGMRVTSSALNEEQAVGAVGPDGAIHIVWYVEDAETGDYDIYYSKSTDGGSTWSSGVRLNSGQFSSPEGVQLPPAIAVDGSGGVHVTWTDDSESESWNVYYIENAGGSWSDITNITSSQNRMEAVYSITVDRDNNVYVLYGSTDLVDTFEIYVAKKSPGGAFAALKIADGYALFGDDLVIMSWYGKITSDYKGRITAAWVRAALGHEQEALDNSGIYWTRSIDGGETWNTPSRLTPVPAAGDGEAISITQMTTDANGRVYILYTYGTGTLGDSIASDAYLAIGE